MCNIFLCKYLILQCGHPRLIIRCSRYKQNMDFLFKIRGCGLCSGALYSPEFTVLRLARVIDRRLGVMPKETRVEVLTGEVRVQQSIVFGNPCKLLWWMCWWKFLIYIYIYKHMKCWTPAVQSIKNRRIWNNHGQCCFTSQLYKLWGIINAEPYIKDLVRHDFGEGLDCFSNTMSNHIVSSGFKLSCMQCLGPWTAKRHKTTAVVARRG